MVKILLCLCIVFTAFSIVDSKLFGTLLPDLIGLLKGGSNSTWQPQLNPLFAGRDDSVIQSLLGVNISLLRLPKLLTSILRPTAVTKDTDGTGTGLWQDSSRHPNKYWDIFNMGKWFGGGNNAAGGGRLLSRVKRALPKNFDWRDYTKCQSVNDIRYQQCGDCWAVASSSVMSDRYCLTTKKNKFFAAKQVVTCVYPGVGGCSGGWPKDAMEYYMKTGVSSGGDPTIKDEAKGCLPYPAKLTNKDACPKVCDSRYALDVTKAGDYYEIHSRRITDIMQEIYDYGPVVAVMEIFDDFGYMGKGIYQHVKGKSLGYHSIRIIGFGELNGVPYWTVANSWGKDWGDMGYFKILRGKNHCSIESWITAVYPKEAYSSG